MLPASGTSLRDWRAAARRLAVDERTRRWALAAVVLLGLAIRLAVAWRWNLEQPDSPARLRTGDEPGYDSLARELLEGKGFTWPGRVPLYPAWLALLHGAFGGSYDAIVWAQVALGVTVVPLTYALARRAFGAWPGVLAALLAAGSYVLVKQSVHLLSEVLFTPALLVATIALWDAVERPSPRRFVWAGLWLGACDLIRPTLLLFPLFAALLLAVRLGRGRWARPWLTYAGTAALVIAPWMAHNWVKHRAFLPLATSNAILWQGSPEYWHLLNDRGYDYARVWNEVLYPVKASHPYPGTIEGERYWNARALRSIRAEPLLYARYAAEKAVTYWVGDRYADWAGERPFTFGGLRRWGASRTTAALLFTARLLPVVALVAALVLRRRWRALLPLYAVMTYCTCLHAATHAEARLSEPLQPLLLVLVAGAAGVVGARVLGVRRPIGNE